MTDLRPSGDSPPAPGAALDAAIARFAAALRSAGMAVTPADVLLAVDAASRVDAFDRRQWRAALAAALIRRGDDLPLFDAVFDAFWLSTPAPPGAPGLGEARADPFAARLAQAGLASRIDLRAAEQADAAGSATAEAVLRRMDIAAMGPAQIAAAAAAAARTRAILPPLRRRRLIRAASGADIDLAETLRAALRDGGEVLRLCTRKRRISPPGLVVLCDISGSMKAYAPVLLHLLHALANGTPRAQVFLFGTRLTPVTQELAGRDIGVALQAAGAKVGDYAGGTSIGAALESFNRHAARRLFASPCDVVLITDGLEHSQAAPAQMAPRDAPAPLTRDQALARLDREMARLARGARRLIWFNPLAGYSGFAPRAGSIQVMLRHVSDFYPGHSLDSFTGSLGAARLASATRSAARMQRRKLPPQSRAISSAP